MTSPARNTYGMQDALADLRKLSDKLGQYGLIDDADDIRIALVEIKRAVNSHAALLAAAKYIVSSRCIDPYLWPQTINALHDAIANAEKDAL